MTKTFNKSEFLNTPCCLSSVAAATLGESASIDIEETSNIIGELAVSASKEGRILALIPVFGVLQSKASYYGNYSYQSLAYRIDQAVIAGATDIGFYIDSLGGSAHFFGLTAKIRSLPERGINTFSFSDNAASAAYGIAAATQHRYGSPSGAFGSIAVMMMHTEYSGEDSYGTTTVFKSKDDKALAGTDKPLSDRDREYITSKLELLDKQFDNDVVQGNTSLTLEKVKALKGADVMGTEAVALGLLDATASNLESAVAYYLEQTQSMESIMTETLEQVQAQLATANETIAALKAADTVNASENLELTASAVAAETERVSTILTTAQTLKVDLATAVKYTDPKYTADIATEILTDLAASADASVNLDTSSNEATAGADGEEVSAGSASLKEAYALATNI